MEGTPSFPTLTSLAARAMMLVFVLIFTAGAPTRAIGQAPFFLDDSGYLIPIDAGSSHNGRQLATENSAATLQHVFPATTPQAPAASSFPLPTNPAGEPPVLEPHAQPTPLPAPTAPTDTVAPGPLLLDEDKVADEVVADAKAEEKKKEEEEPKPVIADLARGILIQQNDGDLTFTPGMRIQPRYNYDANFHENDFFINRFRLKAGGNAYDIARYYVELQLDGTSRFETTPIAQDQNAWLDFTFEEDLVYLRVGLFDLPFSRDAMTSDSRLLIMDRSLIRGDLAALGLADDTVGFVFHGRPHEGHFEYAVGLFDDFAFEKRDPLFPRQSDQLMPAFRLTAALLDPYPARDGYADYWASYLGQATRLDVGVNAAHLGEVFDGPVGFDLTGVGGDIFFAKGHYTFQAEYDFYVENIAFAGDFTGHGWYAQAGYLFNVRDPCLEFAVRYQTLNSDLQPDVFRWTSVGFNWYIRDHNFKIQTDYTFRNGGPLAQDGRILDENVYSLQFQLDF